MSDLPKPFHIDLPGEVPAPRREQYTTCPECGEESFDESEGIRACMATDCGHAEEFPRREHDPEEFAAWRAEMEARMALRKALPRCECCDQVEPALEAVYPVYCDYTGKLIARMMSPLCVPCFEWRQSPGVVEIFGMPTSVKYV